MFGYYTSLPRRKSSATNSGLPRSSVYSSTTNQNQNQPTSPPLSPSSPTTGLSRNLSNNLGSPFSLNFGRNISPRSAEIQRSPPSPVDDRHERDGNGTAGSRSPLVTTRDFGMPGPGPSSSSRQKGYPEGSGGVEEDGDDQSHSRSKESFMILHDHEHEHDLEEVGSEDPSPPLATPRDGHKSLPDPSLVPPPSVHDTYVSSFIRPIETSPLDQSPSSSSGGGLLDSALGGVRPGLHRSSSEPGGALLPSAIPSTAIDGPVIGLADDDDHHPIQGAGVDDSTNVLGLGGGGGGSRNRQPIFEIFNASLSSDGSEMSNDLRNYLEIVLRGQEEVAGMHMQLESLGLGLGASYSPVVGGGGEGNGDEQSAKKEELEKKMKNDGELRLDKREKGVDEIMQRLDSLSETLRTYHQLGTPKLSFTHTNPQSTRTKSRAQSMDPKLGSNAPPSNINPIPSANDGASPSSSSSRLTPPAYVRSNTAVGELSPRKSIGTGGNRNRSPLIHTFKPELSSDNNDDGGSAVEEEKKNDYSSFWTSSKDKEKGGKHDWLEDVGTRAGGGHGGARGREPGSMVASPVEMTDTRSRFW